jgi:hypothetical protein
MYFLRYWTFLSRVSCLLCPGPEAKTAKRVLEFCTGLTSELWNWVSTSTTQFERGTSENCTPALPSAKTAKRVLQFCTGVTKQALISGGHVEYHLMLYAVWKLSFGC